MAKRSKVERARRSIRVTVTTSPGARLSACVEARAGRPARHPLSLAVSTEGQSVDAQVKQLRDAGAEKNDQRGQDKPGAVAPGVGGPRQGLRADGDAP
jgi:hypothetical protein